MFGRGRILGGTPRPSIVPYRAYSAIFVGVVPHMKSDLAQDVVFLLRNGAEGEAVAAGGEEGVGGDGGAEVDVQGHVWGVRFQG